VRKIFGPRVNEVNGNRRKLYKGELHDLFATPNIIQVMETRRMRWVGHVAWMEENKNTNRVLVWKCEGGQVEDHTQMWVKLPSVSEDRLLLRLYSAGDR
jgi:hypothetical protein